MIEKILKKIPAGLNLYLSLVPYGEEEWLEVNCDGKWIALSYCCDGGYYSYNGDFAHTANEVMKGNFFDKSIYTPLNSGGQSPIAKMQAITDIDMGVKAVEYFIWTGKLYPKMDWLHEF